MRRDKNYKNNEEKLDKNKIIANSKKGSWKRKKGRDKAYQ